MDNRLGPRPEFTHFFAEDGDPAPTSYRRGIPHLLRMMNSQQFSGPTLTGLATKVATPGRSSDQLAGDLFLTILSRRPTAQELQQFKDHLNSSSSGDSAIREWAWALLMTSEFSLNH